MKDQLKGKSGAWKDITNNQYFLLKVIEYVGESKWKCLCDCGNYKIVKTSRLNNGHIKSCGCLSKINAIKHNASNTKEYNIWRNIKARCFNVKSTAYKNYGGRGIIMCDEWKNSFENFINDMGECPLGFSIERKNNNLGYNKYNCIWASALTQSLNRRSNFIVTYQNETLPLKILCKKHGKIYKKVFTRIKQLNWTIEDAFEKN